MRPIDADKLKEYVNLKSTHWLNEWDTLGVLAAIDKQPTADVQEVKWTPCDEELPEEEVLCCDVFENMLIGYIEADGNSDTGFTAENEHEIMYDCIAWMPLPEPYKEDE